MFIKTRELEEVRGLLDRLEFGKRISGEKKIVIKPNLVTNIPYPITTDPKLVEILIQYIRKHSKAEIIIAEGSMDDTPRNFRDLGYTELAKKYGVELVDLNDTEVIELENPGALKLKKFYFPKILRGSFIISLACLKEHHSEVKVTLCLKNMFGIAPGSCYGPNKRNKPWQKEGLHDRGLNDCVIDINTYRKPDFCIIDGRIAQKGSEQGGPTEETGVIIAGYDPIEVDSAGCRFLGYEPEEIEHIRKLRKVLKPH